MKTHTRTFLTPAQDLAQKVFDALYHKEVSDHMHGNGAKEHILAAMDSNIQGQFSAINSAFEQGVAREQNKGAFASEFSHALKAEFAKNGASKATWDNMHTQILAQNEMSSELFDRIQEAAFPKVKVVIGSGLAKAAGKSEIPAIDHAQAFADKLKAGLEAHEEHLKLEGSSARVIKGTEVVVAEHYKTASGLLDAGLGIAEDKHAFLDKVTASVEQMVEAHPHTKATLLRPQVHEAIEQHLGGKLAALVQTAAHPEIAKEAAEAASTAESAALKAGAELEKTATKMSGKAKWLVGGAGAAVALGAVMHLDGKSHARNVRNRANNPLNDAALSR